MAILRTHRSTLLLENGKGTPIAELADDTVRVLDADSTVTARFRELELERRKGGKAITRVTEALTEAGAVGGEFVAKLVRALGPAASAAPEVPEPELPGREAPAGHLVAAYLATHVRALRSADVAFRCGTATSVEDEAVHQMRVAARRLRSALRTFRPVLAAEQSKRLRAELAWFARGLGPLREAEVLQARVYKLLDKLPGELPDAAARAALEEAFEESIAQATVAATEILQSDRYLDLHEHLVAAVHDPPLADEAGAPAGEVLPELVRAPWQALVSAADELDDRSSADDWHQVRLRAKRCRYAGEAAALVLGKPAKKFARQVERVTDLLGEHQDASQATDLLTRLARESTDPAVTAALGFMGWKQQERISAIRAEFFALWPDVRECVVPE